MLGQLLLRGQLRLLHRQTWRRSHRFACTHQALVDAGRNVSYALIDSQLGHDDFLMPIPQYHRVLRGYLARVAQENA